MGNSSSKKSGDKKGKKSKKSAVSAVVDDHPAPVVLSPPTDNAIHVVTNREIQDAISRGNVFLL